MIFRFGHVELDEERMQVRVDGQSVPIQPRAFEVLGYLIRHRDRVVSKEELLDRFWPDVRVEPAALSRAIYLSRAAIGDDARTQAMIATVARVGFRFVARVEPVATPVARGDELVGREDVLERLRGDLEAAAQGQGRAAWLEGEAGIGKTRLAQEILREAEARGIAARFARCSAGDGAPPWWPWVQLLREEVRATPSESLRDVLGEGADVLATLLPSLQARLPDWEAPPQLDAASAQFQVLDAITCFLRAVTRCAPRVLLLDDLHWADRSSLRALAHCMHALPSLPVLLIGTYRQEDLGEAHGLPAALAASSRNADDVVLPLRPLSQEATATLVGRLTGRALSPAQSAAVWERSGGNPLFARQIAQLLADEDAPQAALLDRLRKQVSPALRGVIETRLANVSPDCRDLLVLAAALGVEFDVDLLEALWPGGRTALGDALEEAAGRGLLRTTGDGRVRFAHALIQEALRDDGPASRRGELDARIGEALEKLRRGSLDSLAAELAVRFLSAARSGGDAGRAVEWAARATSVAMARLAWDEAAVQAERALEAAALSSSLALVREAELWCALGDASNRAGHVARAREAFERAADRAASADDPDLLARAALGLGNELLPFESGVTDALQRRVLEAALARIPEDRIALRSRLLGRLGLTSAWSGGSDEDRARAEQAVALARRSGDPVALTYALGSLYLNRDQLRRHPSQLEIADELVAAADASHDAHQAIWSRHLRVMEAMKLGRLDAARADVDDMERRASAMRLPVARSRVRSIQAGLVLMEGRLAEGEALAVQALGLGSAGDPVNAMQAFGAHLFFIRLEQGRIGELEGQVRGLVAQFPDLAVWSPTLAMLLYETGRADEAREELRKALRQGFAGIDQPVAGGSSVGTTVQVAAQLGDREAASELAPYLRPLAGLHAAGAVGYYGPFSLFAGMCEALLGEFEAAEASMLRAEREAGDLGAHPYLLRARLERARARLLRGGAAAAAEAGELARRAAEEADARGLVMLASRGRRLAAGDAHA